MLSDEMRLKLMRLLESNPSASQREVAREFGISVGKVNYCLQALVQRGWVKANSFRNSRNKSAYRYLLTPRGIEAKAVGYRQASLSQARHVGGLGAEAVGVGCFARRYREYELLHGVPHYS